MNAAIDLYRLEIHTELEGLRDRLNIAIVERDKARRNPTERQFWVERIEDLGLEISIVQARLKVVPLPGDGGPDEQRRLTWKEDWKRERDSYE